MPDDQSAQRHELTCAHIHRFLTQGDLFHELREVLVSQILCGRLIGIKHPYFLEENNYYLAQINCMIDLYHSNSV